MTQYVINIGAIPNDGTGDPLRTAFNETNLNFNQVFAAGPVLSNIQIANNKILTTNTNGNLILAPNGTGIIQANVSVVPNLANLRNLGSALQRWNTVYTQYVDVSGPVSLSQLTVTGNLTVNGNIIQIGNLVTDAKTIQLSNTAGTANAADGSGITVGANDDIATMLYSSATNAWTFNIGVDTPNIVVNNISSDDSTFVTIQDGLNVQGDIIAETLSTTGNVTGAYFIGNGSQLTGIASSYGNANVATLVASFGSNTISTTGNITAGYFVGNGSQLTGLSTSSISNGTSNVSIATANGNPTVTSAGNTWTFGGPQPDALYWPDGSFQATAFVGQALDLVNTGNASITSNSTGNTTYVWTFGDDGRLAFPGTPRIDTDANNFEVQAAENISLEANAVVNIYTDTSGTTYQWQFGNDGNLTLPANGDLNFSAGGIVQAVDEDFSIRVQDADDDGFALLLQVDDGAGNVLGSTELQRDSFSIQFAAGGAPQFRFDENGVTQLPGNVRWDTYTDQSLFQVSDNNGNGSLELKVISYAGDTLGSNVRVTQSNATISTANALYTWNFDNTGNLTVPGNIIMTTGIVGSGASPAPSLSGFSSVSAITVSASGNVTATGNVSSGNVLTAGIVSATGNITGNYFIGNGSQLTGISGNIANITANVITFNTSAGISVDAGQMAWNSADGTVDIGLSYANVVLQVGQETHYVVRNDTGNIIQNGTAVYCSGVAGGSGRIEASPMMGNIDAVKFLGMATQDISNGVNGVVTYFGYVRGLDTRGTANTAISVGDETWAVGDQLYVHPTAAGKLTNVEPAAPNVKICVASIMIRNQTAGVLFVRPTTNLDLVDLSDVQIDTPAVNQFLVYAGNRWENTALDISVDTSPTLGGNLAGAGFDISNVGNISATGNITGNTAGFAIGYRDIPQVEFTGNATIATTDAGKHFYSTQSSNFTLTIANNASQGFQTGAAITVVNQGSGNITVAQGSGVTLYLAGNSAPGNRTVATFGMATIMKVATDTWFINGTGVS